VLDFAVTEVLRENSAIDALPAVLARLVAAFGVRAALAFQPSATRPATVLAAHPRGADDPGLLARIGQLPVTQRHATNATLASVQLQVTLGGQISSALVTYSAPVAGECLCALGLIGDVTHWDEEIRSAAHAVAAVVAARIRHTTELARLAERQALAQALITRSPSAIIAMDANRHVVEFNPAAEALSGYRRDDLIGKEMTGLLIPRRDRPRFLAQIRSQLRTGSTGALADPVRVALSRADGTERTVELTLLRLTLDAETSLCVFLRDLTEIERSHAALADQTERLNCLIDTAIPGALITDERGRITHISQSFGTMFDIETPRELTGTAAIATMRRIRSQFADPAEFVRRAAEMFRVRKPMSGEQISAADGRTIECDYWPVHVDSRYRGDLWLLWDMSDRTELDRRREEQNVRLRELDDARNQFVAMVSHELRTPLTSIVSFSELIRGEAGGLTPDGLRFLDVIDRNADRLLRLIGDLLLLSRLEAGALPLDVAPVSIPELTSEAVRTASAVAASQDITVDVTTATGPAVLGDYRRLLQVLDNLIGNAVKFSHLHGQVHVTASCDGQAWRIDVSDFGIGIPPGEAARLFGRFMRASNARTAGLPGTGLGLSIVKVIVDLHGGHVDVDTALDRGTTFTVYLPAAP
jgi:PAS domain S-box-containing protein